MTKKGLSAAEQRRRIGASIRSIEDNVSGIRSELTARGSTVVADDDSNGGMDAKARKDGRRHSGPRPSLLKKLKDWLGIAANSLTIVAFVVAVVQIGIGNWQFDRSGPDYTWFTFGLGNRLDLGTGGPSDQTYMMAVLSNSGRTEDTVVSMKRKTRMAENMTICIPAIDGDGNLTGKAALNDGTLKLAPGDSRVLIIATRSTRSAVRQDGNGIAFSGSHFEMTHKMTVYSASGHEWDAKWVDADEIVMKHYENLPGLATAERRCGELVDGKS